MSTHPRFGIEEEFFLLEPQNGHALPVATEVVDALPAHLRARAQREFLASQVEHATGICDSSGVAQEQLLAFRADLARAAASAGAIAAGVGTPFLPERTPTLSPGSRYAELAERHAGLLDDHQVAALHVHVEIPHAEAGVRALTHLAGWLPVVKSLTGNSPWWRGGDTGFDSWRTVILRRWTTGGCPPRVSNAAEYAARATALVGIGGTRDDASVAWDVRLSPRYPTVELRVADSQSTAADALLVALVARGLVSAAIRRPDAVHGYAAELIDAGCWHAARFGTTEGVPVPGESGLVPVDQALIRLTEVLDCPDDDASLIADGLRRLLEDGTGAQRQRRAASIGGWDPLREHLARDLVQE